MPGIPGRPAGPGRPRSPGKPGGPGGPEGPDIPRGPGAPAGPSNCCPCSTVAGSPFAPFSPAPGKIWNSVCKDCSAARNLGPMVGPPPSPSSVESTSGVVCSVSVPESNPCETVAFCPIVTVVVMARGVGVGGRWGTVFSVSGMWREVWFSGAPGVGLSSEVSLFFFLPLPFRPRPFFFPLPFRRRGAGVSGSSSLGAPVVVESRVSQPGR